MPPADAPDWEIWRQVIQPSDLDGIKLVDEILATGMTLRKAWASMIALANPRKEKPARMEKPA
jgi:pyrimidine operon attenuation protein/uracil phosphoribosyltransferase